MLGSTPSGDAYTERQLEEMVRALSARASGRRADPHTFISRLTGLSSFQLEPALTQQFVLRGHPSKELVFIHGVGLLN